MPIPFVSIILLLQVLVCLAVPQSHTDQGDHQGITDSPDLSCLRVISAAEQGIIIFKASEVYECIGKVPFDAAVASRFIDYYNATLQFHSTLKYLKSPPAGYQQPSVDVEQQLQNIRTNISSGAYSGQYAFEADVQLFVRRFHDEHVALDAGILAAFSFASPQPIVSVSEDGLKEPEIYLRDDILKAMNGESTPSPIKKINNQNAVDFLTSLAALNSDGYVESHADWNSLMESPANDIQGDLSLFQRLTFYPGDELHFDFADNTTLDTIWISLYSETESTGPLTTPGDFYNFFVLHNVPFGYDQDHPWPWWPAEYNVPDNQDNSTKSSTEPQHDCPSAAGSSISWCSVTSGNIRAYPNDPIVIQNDFSIAGDGSISGYILDDISTGVLSIPTFMQNDDLDYSYRAVAEFIGNATAKNAKHIIIDLQQNNGGMVLLALTIFHQFFPTLQPYTGTRMRSHLAADILGTAYTEWWESLPGGNETDNLHYENFAASEWVANSRVNEATGSKFSSWAEYSGPIFSHGDTFTQTQLYNLSDTLFDRAMFAWDYVPWADTTRSTKPTMWTADDIVLLTDGLCSSACALFVELMTELAGVRTVVMGGRPGPGPMQTASGNRGASMYSADELDDDFRAVDTLVGDHEAFERLSSRNDTGMYTTYASFNIRDQMRANDEDKIPLQFRYEAADCRLYYTIKNVYNMSQLWRDAATATWSDPGRCVPGSLGYSKRTKNPKPPPAPSTYIPSHEVATQQHLIASWNTSHQLIDARHSTDMTKYKQCSTDQCLRTTTCVEVDAWCGGQRGPKVKLCLNDCYTDGNQDCFGTQPVESKHQLPGKFGIKVNRRKGYEPPEHPIQAADYGAKCK